MASAGLRVPIVEGLVNHNSRVALGDCLRRSNAGVLKNTSPHANGRRNNGQVNELGLQRDTIVPAKFPLNSSLGKFPLTYRLNLLTCRLRVLRRVRAPIGRCPDTRRYSFDLTSH